MKFFDFKQYVSNKIIRQKQAPKKFFLASISFNKLKKSALKIIYSGFDGEVRLDKKMDKLVNQIDSMDRAKVYQEQLKNNIEDADVIEHYNTKIEEHLTTPGLSDEDREILVEKYQSELDDYNNEISERKAQIDDQIQLIDSAIEKAKKKYDYLSEIKDEICYKTPEELASDEKTNEETSEEIERNDNMFNMEMMSENKKIESKNEMIDAKTIEEALLKHADKFVGESKKTSITNGEDELIENIYKAIQAYKEACARNLEKQVQDAKEEKDIAIKNLSEAHKLDKENIENVNARKLQEQQMKHASEIKVKEDIISNLKISHASEVSDLNKQLQEQKAEYERKLDEQKNDYEKQINEQAEKSRLVIAEKDSEIELINQDNSSLKQRLEQSINEGITKNDQINKLKSENKTLEIERNDARLQLAGEKDKNERLTERVNNLEEQMAKMNQQFRSFISSVQEMQTSSLDEEKGRVHTK